MALLLNFINVHTPFLLQASGVIGGDFITAVLRESAVAGILIGVGIFFFKDYQKRLTAANTELNEQKDKFWDEREESRTKYFDLFQEVTDILRQVTSAVDKQEDNIGELTQAIKKIDHSLEMQEVLFKSIRSDIEKSSRN